MVGGGTGSVVWRDRVAFLFPVSLGSSGEEGGKEDFKCGGLGRGGISEIWYLVILVALEFCFPSGKGCSPFSHSSRVG